MIYFLVDVALTTALSASMWVTKQVFGGVYYLAFGETKSESEKTNALLLLEMKQLRECVESLSKEVEKNKIK